MHETEEHKSTSSDDGKMRTFGSGAIRDTSADKLDYEACLSPLVLKRYAEYVKSCRVQPDGNIRADDNWQKGFGLGVWMKSKLRHIIHTWTIYRNEIASTVTDKDGKVWNIETALCAEFFNTHGMLHEILSNKNTYKDVDYVYGCVECSRQFDPPEDMCPDCGCRKLYKISTITPSDA